MRWKKDGVTCCCWENNSGMMNRLGLVNEQELIVTNETGVAPPLLCYDDIFQLKIK
jgi:hypothetical protein